MIHVLHLVFACLAVFLIGVNLYFLQFVTAGLVAWFRAKIAAVTLLLIYAFTGMVYANPDLIRFSTGALAIILDLVAVVWMWHSINRFKNSGVRGYIPLIVLPEDQVPSD